MSASAEHAAREFRLEAEAEELRAEVKKLETELDRAHNDMASSLEREDRFEALSERLIADNKKMRRLIGQLQGSS